jgi:putative phage-type endonuclease
MPRPYTIVRVQGSTSEQINARWREMRKQGIGGSDAGAILGLNPWKSPLSVWSDKLGYADDTPENAFMEWGNRLEGVVAEKFADEHPDKKIRRVNGTFVSRSNLWQFANIDRKVIEPDGTHSVLEIKTASAYSTDRWRDAPPASYVAQVTHYMAVTGWKRAYIAALIGGNDYREYVIERNDDDIDFLNEREAEFWNGFVLTRTMPALVGQPDEAAALHGIYPDGDGELVPGDAITDEIAAKLIARKQRRKELEADIKADENMLKTYIGEADGIMTDSFRVKWVRTGDRDRGLRIKEL